MKEFMTLQMSPCISMKGIAETEEIDGIIYIKKWTTLQLAFVKPIRRR